MQINRVRDTHLKIIRPEGMNKEDYKLLLVKKLSLIEWAGWTFLEKDVVWKHDQWELIVKVRWELTRLVEAIPQGVVEVDGP